MESHWVKNLIEKLFVTFNLNRTNSPSLKVSNKTNIENQATNVGVQIAQANIHHGLSYSDAKDLIETVVDQKMIAFKDEAKLLYQNRVNEFTKLLVTQIKDMSEAEVLKLREPDTQVILAEAAKIAGRKQNPELRDMLADLVIKRIKNDASGKEELKNIVFNEAIATINRLTIDQLKIITLCYLLRYTTYGGVVAWDSFNRYLNVHIKPFISFKNTHAEFQHIEYAGCGSIGIGSLNLVTIYKDQYTFLFAKPIPKDQFDGLSLPETTKAEMFVFDVEENAYSFNFRNKKDLEKYLEEKSPDKEVNKRIAGLYQAHIKTDKEIKDKIEAETGIGKEVLGLFEKTALKHLSLTTVGIAIAITYFERMVGEKINVDIWIN